MKKIILSLLFFLSFLAITPQSVFAACEFDTDCPSDQVCKINTYSNVGEKICVPGSRDIKPTDNSIFGTIDAPRGVAELNDQSEGGIGLILFISNLIKLVSIVAGVWTMFNFIFAGFTYITESGKSGSIEKIGNNLTMSVVGLAIIVLSYTIAGVIGFLIFGDATYIISPTIPTAI